MIGIIFAICCIQSGYIIHLESIVKKLNKSNQSLHEDVNTIIDKYNEMVTHINNMSDIILTFEKR